MISEIRKKGLRTRRIIPGPSMPRPQMLVKDDTIPAKGKDKGGWRVLPYGVMS